MYKKIEPTAIYDFWLTVISVMSILVGFSTFSISQIFNNVSKPNYEEINYNEFQYINKENKRIIQFNKNVKKINQKIKNYNNISGQKFKKLKRIKFETEYFKKDNKYSYYKYKVDYSNHYYSNDFDFVSEYIKKIGILDAITISFTLFFAFLKYIYPLKIKYIDAFCSIIWAIVSILYFSFSPNISYHTFEAFKIDTNSVAALDFSFKWLSIYFIKNLCLNMVVLHFIRFLLRNFFIYIVIALIIKWKIFIFPFD